MLKKLTLVALLLGVTLTLGAGNALAQPAISPGGIGDLLMFGLYDVRDVEGRTNGWQNFIVVENTSNQWTAFHLRFRSWKKSIEVYDHVILLSPYDVFWAVIDRATEEGATTDGQTYKPGDVRIWSQDYRTLYNSGLTYLPQASFQHWLTKFQPDLLDDCGFIADIDNLTPYEQMEMQAGHVEIIGLWQLENPLAPNDDRHILSQVVANVYPDGAINVFDVMNALYYNYTSLSPITRGDAWTTGIPANVRIADVERGSDAAIRLGEDCGNVLAASMSMGDITNARLQLANFLAVSSFRTDQIETPAAASHRDGYRGGAIVFPVETLFWSWATADNGRTAFYVNENWATTVGPGLRDGDAFDADVQQASGGCGNWNIDDFNNYWSLHDLEEALQNNEIWYQYYNGAFAQYGDIGYTTDVVIAFFTKHYHYFFADFPFWSKATAPYDGANAITTQAQYWRAVYDYRGARGASKIGGLTSYRSVEAGTGCNTALTIEQWFEYKYDNGKITGYPFVWDMEQNKPVTQPDFTPPPGSPWKPVPPPAGRWIPHEVNIIRVGAPTPTATGYITDANGMLTNPAPYNYDMGQFALTYIALQNGQRAGGHYGELGPDFLNSYVLPSIGVVIFDLNYGINPGTGIPLYRSSMAPWHFRLVDQNVAP